MVGTLHANSCRVLVIVIVVILIIGSIRVFGRSGGEAQACCS